MQRVRQPKRCANTFCNKYEETENGEGEKRNGQRQGGQRKGKGTRPYPQVAIGAKGPPVNSRERGSRRETHQGHLRFRGDVVWRRQPPRSRRNQQRGRNAKTPRRDQGTTICRRGQATVVTILDLKHDVLDGNFAAGEVSLSRR